MTITAFTDLPTINDKSSFSSRWEDLVNVQLPRFVSETNADIALLNNNSTTGTSTTSTTVGTGSKTFTASTGKSWVINSSVRVYSTASAGIWMDGYVTAYNSGTGSLTVNVVAKSGSGTLASWGIILVPSFVGSDISFSGTSGRFQADFSNATFGSRFLFQTITTNGNTNFSVIPNGTATGSALLATNSSGTTNFAYGSLEVSTTDVRLVSGVAGTGTAIPMTFYVNGGERARITTGGDWMLGKTVSTLNTAGVYLYSNGLGTYSRIDGAAMQVNRRGSDGTLVEWTREGNTVGTISVTTTATTYNTSSDYRLKNNQKPLTGSGEFIDALKPKTWKWVSGENGAGFIAHEFAEVSPSSVVGEKDAVDENGNPIYQAMQASSPEVMANIIAELQALRKRVKDLENK
jgi:hypothetical protein